MKCVIFCGGKGTRLREETEFKPKPMVEIGERPILWHIMKIYSCFGVKDFILTLGYKGESIKRYFAEYRWRNNDFTIDLKKDNITYTNASDIEDWRVSCIDTGLESGTSLRLFKVKQFLETEDDFCLTYGDGVGSVNITELIAFHRKHGKIMTITGLHPRSKYGMIQVDKTNTVTKFIEKPVLSDRINGGFMVVNKKVFDYMNDENVMFESVVLPKLAEDRQIVLYNFDGFWQCMDTYQDLESLNQIWKEKHPWKMW